MRVECRKAFHEILLAAAPVATVVAAGGVTAAAVEVAVRAPHRRCNCSWQGQAAAAWSQLGVPLMLALPPLVSEQQ